MLTGRQMEVNCPPVGTSQQVLEVPYNEAVVPAPLVAGESAATPHTTHIERMWPSGEVSPTALTQMTAILLPFSIGRGTPTSRVPVPTLKPWAAPYPQWSL